MPILSNFPGGSGGVATFNGRKGDVVPQSGDYTAEQVGAIGKVNGAAGQLLGFTAENTVGAVDAPGGFYVGTSAPAKTNLLWIDTSVGTGVLKYYNGSAWVATTAVWQEG